MMRRGGLYSRCILLEASIGNYRLKFMEATGAKCAKILFRSVNGKQRFMQCERSRISPAHNGIAHVDCARRWRCKDADRPPSVQILGNRRDAQLIGRRAWDADESSRGHVAST